ncbi:MAG: hypothetical protein WDN28_14920 [Chthoniobacter sp.]
MHLSGADEESRRPAQTILLKVQHDPGGPLQKEHLIEFMEMRLRTPGIDAQRIQQVDGQNAAPAQVLGAGVAHVEFGDGAAIHVEWSTGAGPFWQLAGRIGRALIRNCSIAGQAE